MIGEPIKQSEKLIGGPIKITGKTGTLHYTAWAPAGAGGGLLPAGEAGQPAGGGRAAHDVDVLALRVQVAQSEFAGLAVDGGGAAAASRPWMQS